MAEGTYRLIVRGELGDNLGPVFDGFVLMRVEGNTALTGTVRDQAQLHSLLQRVSDLGLTLIGLRAIEDGPL